MQDNEIPRGPRSKPYRFFEMLPALLSFSVPVIAVVLSVVDLRLGIIFILVFVAMTLVRAVRGGVDAIRGYRRLKLADRLDWGSVLVATEQAVARARSDAVAARPRSAGQAYPEPRLPEPYGRRHSAFLEHLRAHPHAYPLPSETVHAVVVAAYNEPYEVIESSIRSLAESTVGRERLIVVFAHEQRGGAAMRSSVSRLRSEYGHRFRAFLPVEHPAGLPDEIPGKGANITYAARRLQSWLNGRGIDPDRVLVTTLDCDNRVHPEYLESVSYEFVIDPERVRRSFQPISTFVNNVWHAPAPSRVIAAGNTLWNLISTVRPYSMRNFASHTQPMSALIAMDFWSRRTIVEDGHQYWRSYFHFDGDYRVTPVHLPIAQDAVLADGFVRTLRAQFTQLRRWAYGASDVAYVGVRVIDPDRRAPLNATVARFLLLLDSHVTLASVAPMVAFGAWIPAVVAFVLFGGVSPIALLVSGAQSIVGGAGFSLRSLAALLGLPVWSERFSSPQPPTVSMTEIAAELPEFIGGVQRFAMLGVLVTIVLTLVLMPRRPADVHWSRRVGLLAQWLLLPVTLLCFNTASSIESQARLLFGSYREEFEVTEKRAPQAVGPGS